MVNQPQLNQQMNQQQQQAQAVFQPDAAGLLTDALIALAGVMKPNSMRKDPFLTFYGTPNSITIHEWLTHIESRFQDNWNEADRVHFATRHLNEKNTNLASIIEREMNSFEHLKRALLLRLGTCRGLSLSRDGWKHAVTKTPPLKIGCHLH